MKKLKEILEEVLKDNKSGSLILLEKLIQGHEKLENASSFSSERRDQQLACIREMVPAFKDFPVIGHYLTSLAGFLSANDRRNILDFINDYRMKWGGIDLEISRQASRELECNNKTILLHSNSRTVLTFIGYLTENRNRIKIIQTESRPVMEGRKQAAELHKLGVPVRFITEAAVSVHMKEIDMVVIGSDRLCKDVFINKTGSYAIALLARELKKPFYVLADSRKIAGEMNCGDYSPENKTSKKLWPDAPAGIEVSNFYFEAIPNKLITSLITERGRTSLR